MDFVETKVYPKIFNLRHRLHQHPELSGNEKNTAKRLLDFLKDYKPSKIIENLGGYGIASVYEGREKGPEVIIRADMDGLPITEETDISYKSKKSNIAHMCGHDGHMATLAGLAVFLNKYKIKRGKAVLLFQPSEETGQGAKRILKDKKFEYFDPDYFFSFHNIPGFRKNQIIVKKGVFSAASSGITLNLKGKSSHAAHPEKGKSPVKIISKIINKFEKWNDYRSQNFKFVTVVGINMGEKAFGTLPGKAEFHATLRAKTYKDLKIMKKKIEDFVEKITKKLEIEYNIDWKEEFKSVNNSKKALRILKKAVKITEFSYVEKKNCFRWSEDFGEFTEKYKSCYFGIGIGEDTKNLHNPNYQFQDEIMVAGLEIYIQILKNLNLY